MGMPPLLVLLLRRCWPTSKDPRRLPRPVGDVTGTQLHRIEGRRFRPCSPPGVVTFPSSKNAYTKSFTLCAA